MSQPEKIIVEIAPDASLTVAVECGKGSSCSNLTKELERALGKTVSDKRLPEFHGHLSQGRAQNA
jgi:hypothetical protein